MKNKTSGFRLQKLYLDCIDEKGNCFVIYDATLKFYFVNIRYSGLIFSDEKNETIERSNLNGGLQNTTGTIFQFSNPSLHLSGSWETMDAPLAWVLYTDANDHKLIWDCHHPKAKVNITYKNNSYAGFGYAETLTLPVKPWKLPLDELRWGRFISEKFTVIWIQWKGPHPINKLICNGKVFEDAIFEEDKVIFNTGNFVLYFNVITILRKGKLASVLSRMPWLKLIFKARILNTMEFKYKAKSTLKTKATPDASGWSLYEIVTFTS